MKLLREYNDLAEGYGRLQQHLDEETKFHQEQTSQNVALMTEMQETIEQLRNQLTDLRASRSASSGVRNNSDPTLVGATSRSGNLENAYLSL